MMKLLPIEFKMSKKILIVDDDPKRIKFFQKQYQDEHLVVACDSYKKAVKALQLNSPFDIIQLDYDLHYCNDDSYIEPVTTETRFSTQTYSGADVAYYIINFLSFDERPKHVIIHSWNDQGVIQLQRMFDAAKITNTYSWFK